MQKPPKATEMEPIKCEPSPPYSSSDTGQRDPQMCGAWLDFLSWGQEASSHLPRWPWRRLGKGMPCGQLQAPTLRVNQARDGIGGGREEGRERVRKREREREFVNPSITKVACQYCTCLKGKNGEFLSSNILSNPGTAATKVALMLISHLL